MATEVPKPQEQQKPSFLARVASLLPFGNQTLPSQKPEDSQLPILPIPEASDENLGWQARVDDEWVSANNPKESFRVTSPGGIVFRRVETKTEEKAIERMRRDVLPLYLKLPELEERTRQKNALISQAEKILKAHQDPTEVEEIKPSEESGREKQEEQS